MSKTAGSLRDSAVEILRFAQDGRHPSGHLPHFFNRDQVYNFPDHAANLRRVVLFDDVAWSAQAQRFDRPLLRLDLVNDAPSLCDSNFFCHCFFSESADGETKNPVARMLRSLLV
jgi:hypothetical protein